MFTGEWTDKQGRLRRKGMADLLATPTIEQWCGCDDSQTCFDVAVPLWIECKAGTGELSADQRDFRDFVKGAGAGYLCLRDSADELIEWFNEKGVTR